MLKQLIDYFIHIALMHKAVKYSKYKNKVYTNAQNNDAYMQFNIDTDPYFQLLVSLPNQPFTMTVNIDILGFPTKEYSVLDCQSDALQVGVEFIHYIKQDIYFMGKLDIHDYSFLALDEYTDDKSAGQRLTLEVVIPNPINLCYFMDNFSEDFIPEEKEDKEIDIIDVNPPSKSNDLILKPVLIPHK